MNAKSQIAAHLKIEVGTIARCEEWAKVWFVVIQGKGGRFVSKKVVKKMTPLVVASLDEAPAPEIEPEILTTRARLNRLVRDYSGANAMHSQEVWRRVYREFEDKYHVDLQRAKNIQANRGKKLGALDVCEQLSMIEELYAVAFDLLKV